MEKLLVCLEVPSILQTYEMYLPTFLKVSQLIPLLVKAVKELSGGQYVSSGHEFLCAARQNVLLPEDAVIGEYDIGNGDHLVLL